MPRRMAITHADLEPNRRSTDLGSKTGAFLIILTILCGLFCFVLCLIAEATRSEATRVGKGNNEAINGGKDIYECVYSGSGETPLLCAAAAFVGLAIAMVMEHTYMLIAISKSPPPALVAWDPDCPRSKSLTWQAGFFFVSTWVCFAVGEILLLIGLSVESGHLKNWSRPKPSCLIIREGLFSAAGILSLTTVFLAAGLYLTALRAQRAAQELEHVRWEVLEASALYASPPRSPPQRLATIARENPINRENQNDQNQHPTSFVFSQVFNKHSFLV